MPWAARTVESVADGANSTRKDLFPGEWAHVQVEYTSATTDRMLVRILSTNEDSPGVADLDTVPLLEFRLDAAEAITFVVSDVHAIVVAIDNDQGGQSLTADVRVRKSNVDFSA